VALVTANLSVVEQPDKSLNVCATCTRCGHVASVTATSQLKADKAEALILLGEECPEADKYHAHVDRIIPVGVHLWYLHPADDEAYELSAAGRKVYLPALGACLPTVSILVVPDTKAEDKTAREFAYKLHKWGYATVRVTAPGWKAEHDAKAVAT
jgi:hypothetical protein